MNPWEIAISAVGSFLLYGAVAVWVGFGVYSLTMAARYRWHVDRNPETHKRGLSYDQRCDCSPPFEPETFGCVSGLFWPLGVWLLLGLHLVFRAERQRPCEPDA